MGTIESTKFNKLKPLNPRRTWYKNKIQKSRVRVLCTLTATGCSTRSSRWLWWTTNKTRPAMENNPRSTQIQNEGFLRTTRRRRIFCRFLPQFTTKSRMQTNQYPRFNQKAIRSLSIHCRIKNSHWPKSQIQSTTHQNKASQHIRLVLAHLGQIKMFHIWKINSLYISYPNKYFCESIKNCIE